MAAAHPATRTLRVFLHSGRDVGVRPIHPERETVLRTEGPRCAASFGTVRRHAWPAWASAEKVRSCSTSNGRALASCNGVPSSSIPLVPSTLSTSQPSLSMSPSSLSTSLPSVSTSPSSVSTSSSSPSTSLSSPSTSSPSPSAPTSSVSPSLPSLSTAPTSFSMPPTSLPDDAISAVTASGVLRPARPRWHRVLLKVSGEALAGDRTQNVDPKVVMSIAREVASVNRIGVEVAIVVGGGNFFRGSQWAGESGLDRASADQIGMIATVMNAIFLQASLESLGVPTRVQTAFKMAEVAEPYIRRRAMRHLEKGRVVIFAAGTGNPFFTTDTAAVLRAAEINAEVVLKATNVDGVYDSDPRTNPQAELRPFFSYREVALRGLCVMDATAITLCEENQIPVVVFNLNETGNISRALIGERIGTLIDKWER